MTARITVNLKLAEGCLVRVLGLIERRGYVVRGLSMKEQADCASLIIDVEPRDAARRVPVLTEQLVRLVEVNSVTVATRDTGSPA